jgi:folate-binding protein YgfZ
MLSTKEYSLLPDRTVVAVSGEDAREFLQGLITNDIHKVTAEKAVFAALLSPQGKFLYDFFIIAHDGKFLLETDKAGVPELIKRLTMYKLRSRVEISEMPEIQVAWSKSQVSGNIVYADPRLPEMGFRIIGKNLNAASNDEYDKNRISLGIPEGGKDLIYNKSFPMQWAYDKLNAIDFNKGCYVGQEVTARSKHIGTMRKAPYMIQAEATLPPQETPVLADGKEIGVLASSINNTGLALLNIEAVNTGKLSAAEMAITAILPKWAA